MNKGEFVLREDVEYPSMYKPKQGYDIRESTLFEKPGDMETVKHYSGSIYLNRNTVNLLYGAIMSGSIDKEGKITMGVTTTAMGVTSIMRANAVTEHNVVNGNQMTALSLLSPVKVQNPRG